MAATALRRTASAVLSGHSRRRSASRTARAGQDMNLVSTMIAIVVAATVGYVGLSVMSTTEGTTDFNTSQNAGNQTSFENASESLTGGVESAFGLVEVVFIAIILGLVVGALVTLRR